MELGLDGRIALVMGVGHGIGQAIAASLVREGARVAISGHSAEVLEEVAAQIGPGVTPFVVDPADTEKLAGLPAAVSSELGEVEILVTNSGGLGFDRDFANDLDEWGPAYQALVLTPRLLSGAVVPAMRRRGWGRIVDIGPSATRQPLPGLNPSNSHRVAAVSFLKTLSHEVAADGVTVNAVATGRVPSGPLLSDDEGLSSLELDRSEEYGDVIAFLCSERSAYLTGAVIPVDVGVPRSAAARATETVTEDLPA